MAKVGPVYVEAAVIVHVQQLMRNGVFHVFLVCETVLAKQHRPRLVSEPACAGCVTWSAQKIGVGDVAARQRQVFAEKHDNRTCS